jgi:hypothetical protein
MPLFKLVGIKAVGPCASFSAIFKVTVASNGIIADLRLADFDGP